MTSSSVSALERPTIKSPGNLHRPESGLRQEPPQIGRVKVRELESVERRPDKNSVRAELLVPMQRIHALFDGVVLVGLGTHQESTVGAREDAPGAPHARQRARVVRHELQ